jgi:phenol 2-monooxygenase
VINRFTPAGMDIDGLFDFRFVLQQPHRQIEVDKLPRMMLPAKGRFGLLDYEKAFANDAVTDIFTERGIDRERGALVVVRPDQYVAHVLPLNAYQELSAFFAPIFNRVGSEIRY